MSAFLLKRGRRIKLNDILGTFSLPERGRHHVKLHSKIIINLKSIAFKYFTFDL